jgi:5-methylcytosine-specific restriction endonuclease McrA
MNEKPYCYGLWTKARFKSFVTSALRRASSRWAPKYTCKKKARTARNTYKCSLCANSVGNKDIKIDHIHPVVDPTKGFESWDKFIERLFVELDGYQAICITCHKTKTAEEREIRKKNK